MIATATRPAQIPPSMRLYVVGDVHGMIDLLNDTFRRIDLDLESAPVPVPLEIYLGDMVDRGPDSRGVLDALLARSAQRNVICLTGNHELMMMRGLNDLGVFKDWLQLGGSATLQSYGLAPETIRPDAATQREFRRRLTPPVLDFLMSLQPSFKMGDYLFVHAGIRPGVPFALQSIQDLTSIRREFLTSEMHFGFIVVHGHTPCDAVEIRANRINLDTGAYKGGPLTCVAFEDIAIRRV